jgi:hypothetical protein
LSNDVPPRDDGCSLPQFSGLVFGQAIEQLLPSPNLFPQFLALFGNEFRHRVQSGGKQPRGFA